MLSLFDVLCCCWLVGLRLVVRSALFVVRCCVMFVVACCLLCVVGCWFRSVARCCCLLSTVVGCVMFFVCRVVLWVV